MVDFNKYLKKPKGLELDDEDFELDLGGRGEGSRRVERGEGQGLEDLTLDDLLGIGDKEVKRNGYWSGIDNDGCNDGKANNSVHSIDFSFNSSNDRVTTIRDTREVEYDEFGEEDSGSAWYKGVILGQAGTGKSTLLRNRIKEDKKYGLLCATTGIAAINLSTEQDPVSTINSTLGYFDTQDLEVAYGRGRLMTSLIRVSEKARHLIVDEMSMWDGNQLDILHRALGEVNKLREVEKRGGLGLIMVGDFLQLPPVKAPFVFEMEEWGQYEPNVEKLTKIYRQTDPAFLEALQAARRGDGDVVADRLMGMDSVRFLREPDYGFDGTTIYVTNEEVRRHNNLRLGRLIESGKKKITHRSYRWGRENQDWKNIPSELEVAEGAYVMILNNYRNPEGGEGLVAANGSKGWVREWDPLDKCFIVELEEPRFEMTEIPIYPITRRNYEKYKEEIHGPVRNEMSKKEWKEQAEEGETYREYLAQLTLDEQEKRGPNVPYYDYDKGMMVVGEIKFVPLRLGWATSVHKCISATSIVTIRSKFGGVPWTTEIDKVNTSHQICNGNSWVTVIGVSKSEQEAWIVALEDGSHILCSAEHRFPVMKANWVMQAKELTCNMSLYSEKSNAWVRIVAVRNLGYRIPMVDIEVDSRDHLYIANGILTHNSQGLTLTNCQIDFAGSGKSNHMWRTVGGLGYVALSRVREPEGLRVVGTGRDLREKINVSGKVLRWA